MPLSAPVFVILSGLIEERLGLYFRPEDSDLLAEKVSPRAVERGFDSLLDYYYFLRYDAGSGPELEQLAEALVVNETYLGRELSKSLHWSTTSCPTSSERGVACGFGRQPARPAKSRSVCAGCFDREGCWVGWRF
jgi:hypothetical protein